MQKTKLLYHNMIKKCIINIRLFYNTNTDHIGIRTSFQYQDSNKTKEYNKNNKDKIKKYNKEYYENNKEKYKEYAKQYYKNNRDPNKTMIGSEEYRIKLSCIQAGIDIEDFDGFIRNQKYCYKFNNSCRELNREKYNRKCFICGKNEFENNRKLSVHHIDMNKQQGCNDTKWKLIPLCSKCHARSHNDLWEGRLEYLLKDQKALSSLKPNRI